MSRNDFINLPIMRLAIGKATGKRKPYRKWRKIEPRGSGPADPADRARQIGSVRIKTARRTRLCQRANEDEKIGKHRA